MRRLLVYAGESALLSVLLWLALVFTAAAMRALGRSMPRPGLRVYLQVWALSLLVDALGSEVRGPEFLFLYKLALLAPLLGALFWIVAVLKRRWWPRFTNRSR
jgi:hypothetical protein